MRIQSFRLMGACLVLWSSIGLACSSTTSPQGGSGGASSPASKGGATAGGATGTGGAGAGGMNTGGTTGQAGGATSTGGQSAVGGQSGTGGQAGQGTGGIPAGGATGTGGKTGTGGQVPLGTGGSSQAGGTTSSPIDAGVTSSCVPTKTWGTADPSSPGPFEVVADKNVGPAAGVADALHNNQIPHFNVYRPKDLTQGYCHPIITWGNGTGDQPEPDGVSCLAGQCGHYLVLLDQLASHGFVVVASLSSQTAQGNPIPQVAGVDWMIQANDDPTSPYYHHLDTTHIGATGHSQGGAATTMAGADPRITAIAPIAGARATTLHGPAALLCGGQDTTVPCSSVQPAFDADNNLPVMMGDNLAATHGSWIGSIKDPYMIAVTGWMRVHLMGDTANRNMFYGASCKLCTDTQHWKIQRKMMDQ